MIAGITGATGPPFGVRLAPAMEGGPDRWRRQVDALRDLDDPE